MFILCNKSWINSTRYYYHSVCHVNFLIIIQTAAVYANDDVIVREECYQEDVTQCKTVCVFCFTRDNKYVHVI